MGKTKKPSAAVKAQYGMRSTLSQAEINQLEQAASQPVDLDALLLRSKAPTGHRRETK